MAWTLNQELRCLISSRFQSFERRALEHPPDRSAAVAVPLVEAGYGADLPGMPEYHQWQEDAALLLTRRSMRLLRHPGQWAFPGGRIDAGEDVYTAALRELQEEVGCVVDQADVLGLLDDFVTRSGFLITPVVVWAGKADKLLPSPDEVESAHRIPLTELQRSDAPILEKIPESTGTVLKMPIGANFIAAPTAAILYQFREVLMEGRQTRVAHFEQPVFAWS